MVSCFHATHVTRMHGVSKIGCQQVSDGYDSWSCLLNGKTRAVKHQYNIDMRKKVLNQGVPENCVVINNNSKINLVSCRIGRNVRSLDADTIEHPSPKPLGPRPKTVLLLEKTFHCCTYLNLCHHYLIIQA